MKSLSLWTQRGPPITEDHKEDPTTEKSKESKKLKSLKNLKGTLSLRILKKTLSLRPSGVLGPSMTFTQNFCFGFLVIVYDRVGDEGKFLCKNFVLEKSRFHATVT